MAFEWDDAKAAANLKKHGIGFDRAAMAFGDPFAIERRDLRAFYAEERFVLIGLSGTAILSVVYTEREDRIRIISAWRATKHEIKDYHSQNAD
jgi:uncharacterized protein